jgi:cysteinyl-tRNA synthetase
MFGTHYRKKLDWSDDALAAAREGSHRLGEFQNRLLQARSNADSPRFVRASEQLTKDLAEALDDDLNAPRAVAAMFAYMNEGNAALDAGDRPGQAAIAAWERADGVLGVTSDVVSMKITGTSEGPRELPETPPADQSEELQKNWALQWASRRKQAKDVRNYAEADRIRTLLRAAGWEVRDARDGSIDVVRIRRAS